MACIWYFRHELRHSTRNLLLLGIGPLLGGLMLFGIGIKAAFYYGHTDNVESAPILGITLPLWMGIGGLIPGGHHHAGLAPVLQREFFSHASPKVRLPMWFTAAAEPDPRPQVGLLHRGRHRASSDTALTRNGRAVVSVV